MSLHGLCCGAVFAFVVRRRPWRNTEIRCRSRGFRRPLFGPIVLQLHHVCAQVIRLPGDTDGAWQARTTCGRSPGILRRRPQRCCVCCWIHAPAPAPRMLCQLCCTSCGAPSTASCRMVVEPMRQLRPASALQPRAARLVADAVLPVDGEPSGLPSVADVLSRCCKRPMSRYALASFVSRGRGLHSPGPWPAFPEILGQYSQRGSRLRSRKDSTAASFQHVVSAELSRQQVSHPLYLHCCSGSPACGDPLHA